MVFHYFQVKLFFVTAAIFGFDLQTVITLGFQSKTIHKTFGRSLLLHFSNHRFPVYVH